MQQLNRICTVILAMAIVSPPLFGQVGMGSALPIPPGNDWIEFLEGANVPVNIAPLNERKCFVCSYRSIHLVDLVSGEDEVLAKPEGVDVWNPTGVFYNQATQLLYIANYNGHDVLLLKYDEGELRLQRRITSEHLRSPEGIAVSRDGNRIAVADYEGSAATLFDQDGSLIWVREVPLAHGICFSHDESSVLVTSLGLSGISRFRVDGQWVETVGSRGWLANKYLWPTSIAQAPDGQFLVCDAHTGQISVLDSDLKEVRTIGGNGPGAGLFNMPYHATFCGKNVVVADTFKDRLVSFDLQNHRVNRALYWRGSYRNQDTTKVNRQQYTPMGEGYVGYKRLNLTVNLRRYIPNLPDDVASPSYNAFECPQHSYRLSGARPLLGGNGMYFVEAHAFVDGESNAYLLVSCPQRATWFLIGKGYCAPLKSALNCWIVDHQLVSDFEAIALNGIVSDGASRLKAFETSPVSGAARVSKELLRGHKHFNVEDYFDTASGREYWQAYQSGSPNAERYYSEAAKGKDISLFEWCLVNAINAKPPVGIKVSVP